MRAMRLGETPYRPATVIDLVVLRRADPEVDLPDRSAHEAAASAGGPARASRRGALERVPPTLGVGSHDHASGHLEWVLLVVVASSGSVDRVRRRDPWRIVAAGPRGVSGRATALRHTAVAGPCDLAPAGLLEMPRSSG